jgi:beta-phosphoglucomutase-like phosphatase (HAD superfamily)
LILDSERVVAETHRQFLQKYKKDFPQSLRERIRGRGDVDSAKEIIKALNLNMPPQQYIHGVWQLQRIMLRDMRLVEGINYYSVTMKLVRTYYF